MIHSIFVFALLLPLTFPRVKSKKLRVAFIAAMILLTPVSGIGTKARVYYSAVYTVYIQSGDTAKPLVEVLVFEGKSQFGY